MSDRVFNFSAGPAALPLPALERAHETFLSLPGVGASAMEISHRSAVYSEIHERAKSNIRTLLGVPDSHHILFMQGGATLQFSAIAMNFLKEGASADYIVTGSWGSKAIKEAQKEGSCREAWNGKEGNFSSVPGDGDLDLDANAAYCHFTSNETIQGVEFQKEPEVGGAPLICDASSDFLARPIAIEKYSLLYAGAQKNIGPAGVAVAIVSDELIQRVPDGLPSVLDYKVFADNDSLYNTPPCWAIYIISLTTDWVLNDIGGLAKMEEVNRDKAAVIYDVIDNSGGFYNGHADKNCRSIMNVTWRLASEELEKKFIADAAAAGLSELKGHRSVGGVRASIYNAMPKAGCEALATFMNDFQKAYG